MIFLAPGMEKTEPKVGSECVIMLNGCTPDHQFSPQNILLKQAIPVKRLFDTCVIYAHAKRLN